MRITVLVKPNSKKEAVEKISENEYVVRVNAIPADGKANARVIELLAQYFNCAKSKILMVVGSKSKKKIFDIQK